MSFTNKIDENLWTEWVSTDVLPKQKMWTMVREREEQNEINDFQKRLNIVDSNINGHIKRVLFSGRYWMSQDSFNCWKPCHENEKSVTALISKDIKSIPKIIDELELVDYNHNTSNELATLAELSRLELNVDLVRIYKPKDDSDGALSGKILAVSKKFAAQSIGSNGVVIHEQNKLSRHVYAGEQVTLNYASGKANVLNGSFFDVEISSTLLSKDEIGWLRMNMIEALSSVENADKDEVMIQEALHYALDKTAEMFPSLRDLLTKSKIHLSVVDIMPNLQTKVANKTGHRVDDLNDDCINQHSEKYLAAPKMR